MTMTSATIRPWLAARVPVLRLGAAAIGVAAVSLCIAIWVSTGPFPIDTAHYLGAGTRLNDALPLYAATDQVGGYAQVAIFSPPLIAVLIRPLSMLPFDVATTVWVALMAICEFAALALLLRRSPGATGIAMAVVAPAIALTVVVGNLDALVLLVLVTAWPLLRDGRGTAAALLLALVASLKLTPVALLWWLLVTGRRREFAIAAGACVALALVAMLGSEPLIFVRFIEVTLANYGGSAGPLSLAGVGRGLGLDPSVAVWLPRLALVGGLVSIVAFRRHRGATYATAVATMVLASPVAAFHTPALLLGILVPFVRYGANRVEGAERLTPATFIRSAVEPSRAASVASASGLSPGTVRPDAPNPA